MTTALFEMMKLQLFTAAMQPGTAERIDASYIYAWRCSVYPFFHEVEWHKPFADQFEVSEDMMDALSRHLDECDLAKNIPTFYELETHYRVRSAGSEWNRWKLLCACRYMALNERFGTVFWNSVLRGSDHPSEAKSIARSYSPLDELSIA